MPCTTTPQHGVAGVVGALRGLDELAEILAQRVLHVALEFGQSDRLFLAPGKADMLHWATSSPRSSSRQIDQLRVVARQVPAAIVVEAKLAARRRVAQLRRARA